MKTELYIDISIVRKSSFLKLNTYIGLFLAMMLWVISGCEEFVDGGDPKDQINSSKVFLNDATADSSLKGVYSEMMNNYGFASGGNGSITFLTSLSSDEFVTYAGGEYDEFNFNSLAVTNSYIESYLWGHGFKFIYYANAILEGLSNSSALTEKTKNQLEGEAKFIRAFCNFYLVNLYGDIPLITTTDYRINRLSSRVPEPEIYEQIVSDLKDAQNLLLEDYSYSKDERIRPNKWVATALLARVYLYLKDYSHAEEQATAVIDQTQLYDLESDLNNVFLANSSEAIWQLRPENGFSNTKEGEMFILTYTPYLGALSETLVDAFEPSDDRKENWVGSFDDGTSVYYFPYKYKVQYAEAITEYSMVFRLAEQFLIRAEARAQLENTSGAREDLNAIRNRAGLSDSPSDAKDALLVDIEHERRVELFFEWGHRWFDLRRNIGFSDLTKTRADEVLGPIKGSTWQSTDIRYPIPQSEIQKDKNLSQNLGY